MIEDHFISKGTNTIKKITDMYIDLHSKVEPYVVDNRPILSGEILKYKDLIGENCLPIESRDPTLVFEKLAPLFQRAVQWEKPGAMINITPPINITAATAAFYSSLYNPNFAQDEPSGYLLTTELLVCKYLSDLVGWKFGESGGTFTFGGKGTCLYALKIGLSKALSELMSDGIDGRDIIVYSSEKSHPCHAEVCDWLGIGKKRCKKLLVGKDGRIQLKVLEKNLRESIESNIKIGCIFLSGGTTNELIVDPIKKVVNLRDRLVKEYNLDYTPHVHVDSVIGWAWLFYKEYDFKKNQLQMSEIELSRIKSLSKKISEIFYADSFGADFHKTGFCPYASSIFMSRDFNEVTALGGKKNTDLHNMSFGEYSPFEYTLELSRSSIGPISAYTTLESLGISGFQEIIYRMFSNGNNIRNYLSTKSDFEVINMETEGIATLFIIKPTDETRSYFDLCLSDDDSMDKLLEYNHQFYLYCLQQLELYEVDFKLTFSKSYKPYNSNKVTGALKIYPTSITSSKEQVNQILEQLVYSKKKYDNTKVLIKDNRRVPDDFVYRD